MYIASMMLPHLMPQLLYFGHCYIYFWDRELTVAGPDAGVLIFKEMLPDVWAT